MPLTSVSRARLLFHDLQGVVPKGLYNPPGQDGADPLDGPAGQIFQDGCRRWREIPLVQLNPELGAIGGMGGEKTGEGQLLPHLHIHHGAHHCDQFLAGIELQNSKARVLAFEGDAVHAALQLLVSPPSAALLLLLPASLFAAPVETAPPLSAGRLCTLSVYRILSR